MLREVRTFCLSFPDVSERLSHGADVLRAREALVRVGLGQHHGDGRFALVFAAPPELQEMLVDADPDRFYVPSYVGHRGWLGVRLDRGFHRDEIAGILDDAYETVTTRRP